MMKTQSVQNETKLSLKTRLTWLTRLTDLRRLSIRSTWSTSIGLLVLIMAIACSALAAADEIAPATVSYSLPIDGPLPKTYRVTLAITAPDNPDWIVSTFVAGAMRTVTAENQGRFTETWDGLDENFMPVPPGEYGVKGIYMPAEIWAPDGKPHTLRAKLHGSPFALAPKPGVGETGPFIWGDPIATGMGDVAVGSDGIAVFYWKFLENGNNPYRVDLTQPLGHGQLLSGFGSGGTGGGDYVATDGQTVWAVAPTDNLVGQTTASDLFLYWPFLYRADQKPFGAGACAAPRKNVTLAEGRVTGLAAWRPKGSASALLLVAERGKIVAAGTHVHGGLTLYAESKDERINALLVLDGATARELTRLPVVEPTALTVAHDRLHLLERRDGGWTERHLPLPPDGMLDPAKWSQPRPLAGLKDPRDLAVDSHGRLYVADAGVNRVLRFAPSGQFELAFGAADAQREGNYDPLVFMQPARLACWRDAGGVERLLVVETGGPSRISEWSTDGKLLRDWHGLLTHAGNSGFTADPESPEHLYIRGQNDTLLRYRVDYATGKWELEAVWHGVPSGSFPRIIHRDGRKYLTFNRTGKGSVIYRFAGDRVLAAAGIVREERTGQPSTYFSWHDANGNGMCDPEERSPLALPGGMKSLRYWGDYWLDDLSLLVPATGTADVYRLSVKRFDDHGNPVFGAWKKTLTDETLAAKAAGTATALRGGNEAVSAFNGDWGCARQLPSPNGQPGDIVVNMRGGGFSANHGWQQKLSRYVPDGNGGFRQKWRVGRSANIAPGRGEILGSIHVTLPMFGLIAIIDQSRAGVHVYDWDSGLFVDTLMLPGHLQSRSIYGQGGEYFSGGAHVADGKVYLCWGKTTPLLFEVEGWTKDLRLHPIKNLPAKVSIRAAQIAAPPEQAVLIRGGAGAAKIAEFQPLPGGGPALDGSLAGWETSPPLLYSDDQAKVEVRCGYDPDTLYLRWEVRTQTPMSVPPMPSPERLFTHDREATTLSFYLQGDAAATGRTPEGRPGDLRIVFGLYDDQGKVKSAALGLYPRWDGSGTASPFLYASPGQRTAFAHVGLLDMVKMAHRLSNDRKTMVIAAAIPRSVLPKTVPDLAKGWRAMANFEATIGGAHKLWWANTDGSASRETRDEPTEARFYPGSWAQCVFVPLADSLPIRAWLLNGPWKAEIKYTGADENKRQFQRFFDTTTFPPDSRQITPADIAIATPSEAGQWRPLITRVEQPREQFDGSMSHSSQPSTPLLFPDDGQSLYNRGCNLYFAIAWIWSPEDQEVQIEFPRQHQNNIRAWLNDTRLVDAPPSYGVYQAVASPQLLRLRRGWNQLFLRAYALGYDLHFGAVIKAAPEKLWQLRISASPPAGGTSAPAK
jgi:hypothetical protein